MSYYNESLFDNGTTFYDMSIATNTVTNGLYASIIILGSLFIIVFAILKSKQNDNSICLLYSGLVTSFVSVLLFFQGFVSINIVMTCVIPTAFFIGIYKLVES